MRWKTLLAIVLIIGIIDASYLTVVHFAPAALKCPTLGTKVNCETVLTSSFSNIMGIPLAVLGLAWFVASVFMLAFGYKNIIRNVWMIIGLGGVIYSVASQYIIGEICIYCTILDILIILSGVLFIYSKK